ncbi:MAG TPA: iron-containing alcohol dehydrogenase, partial [Candidatus Udaeobacter sp.]|nr:iron-containing alcohol dehydrogenase [Candidatus Udaeobacter sp.]
MIVVRTGTGRILIGEHLLPHTGDKCRAHVPFSQCVIISDSNVAPPFAHRVSRSLASAGFHPTLITIPAGEKSKTLQQVSAICDRMIAAGLDRKSFVVGLGGGMIGDISGFVAAIYQRGIPHVQ